MKCSSSKAIIAVLKIMIVSTGTYGTQKADDASDRAHDGRDRQRGTQIISPLKLAIILMDSSSPLTQ